MGANLSCHRVCHRLPRVQQSPPQDQQSPPQDQQSPPQDQQSPPQDQQSPPQDQQSPLQDQQSPRQDQQSLPQVPNLQFRVLIIGRANAGKTSILQRVCDTTESPEIYKRGPEGRERVRSRF